MERFNLAQQPEAFVAHPEVTEALRERGDRTPCRSCWWTGAR